MKSILTFLSRFILCAAFLHATHAEELVGSLPGQLSVEQGAVVYTIPIEVPPGVAGMQPDLAITYNSNAGNGLLGVGFSLSGLSVITRCGQTIAQDGQKGGVYYDGRDRFCLDGQRLIAISGSDGGDGSEYRTEIDSYSRIISHGQQGSGPQWWRVETKSGQVMEFGNTQDSRIEAQGKSTARLWAVNRIEDTVGNGIDFEYHEDNGNGEYYPTRILYAGGVVEFGYEGRDDKITGYEAGSLRQVGKLISRIESRHLEGTHRDYGLRYGLSSTNNLSLLSSVSVCSALDNCLPTLNIEWKETEISYSIPTNSGINNIGWNNNSRGMDVNGDGRSDLVLAYNNTWNILFGNGTGLDSPTNTGISNVGWNNNPHVMDVNGDGRSDLVLAYNSTWNILFGNGTGFDSPINTGISNVGWNNNPHVMDVNGDGRSDLVLAYNSTWNILFGNGTGFNSPINTGISNVGWNNNPHVMDINGDGRSDLVLAYNSTWNILFGNGTGFNSPVNTGISNVGWNNNPHVMDVNGDGRSDLVLAYNSTWNILFGNGAGFNSPVNTEISNIGWNNNPHVMDLNGDGRSDLVLAYNNTWNILFSNGNGFNSPVNTGINNVGWNNQPRVLDVDGDGNSELVLAYNSVWNLFRISEASQDVLTALSNGFDVIDLDYEPLSACLSCYQKDHDAVYPALDLASAQQVISQLQTTTPTATQTTTYRYGGLKANLHGRGSLGFRWIEATDHTRNTITRTEYNQSFPHVGSPERSTTHLIHDGYGGNILLSETETQYDHVTGHSDRVYSPHVVQTTERSYGLDRSLLTTVTTENDLIDGFGNIGRITATTQGAGETHVKVSTNDYINDEQRWILGRLTRASVTHIAPDNSQITRASEFAYDAQTGLLTLEAIEPNTALSQTTRYQYDQHGNQIAVTLSAPGLPDRTTQTQYDAVGRFPIRVTNALGHSETREYDSACGNPISLTGPNGLTTRWEYDSLCRKARETRADGAETTWDYQWAGDDAPGHALYSLTETASGAPPVTIFYDALNREVRKDTVGFDGRTIHQETEYNARGEIVRQSLPHFAGETAYWVTNTYDLLGRPASVSRPAGVLTGQSAAITQYAYSGFATTVTDAMGRQKTTIKNALGRVVRVEEEEGAWLTHAMDAIGNLMETNAGGVITRMGYDIRGNKVWMEDPDMGRWEYLYNGFGELIGQTDAKGQLVTMEYDQLGRMVRRQEPEGVTTWEYDTAENGIGKLALIRAPNGFYKSFAYDGLGRPIQTSTHADGQDFNITTGYDEFGRVRESIRPSGSIPGGFTVQHVYNAYGYLSALRVPREHILDYDTAHLHTLYQNTREMAVLLLDETTDYLEKAAEYRAKAGIYEQLADQEALYARTLALLGEAQGHMQANAEPGTVFAPINAARELIRPLAETALQAEAFPELATTLEGVAQELSTAAAGSAEELDAKLAELERWGAELERISDRMARMDHDPYHLYLWQAKGRDAAGRLTGTLFGNGLSTNKIYDPASGELLTIQSGFGTALPIRDLGYTYDLADNVTARFDRVQDIQETFQYDRLDRLTASTVSGQIGQTSYHNTLTYTYDAQGNMTHHSGVGAYLYGAGTSGPGPHATTRAGEQEIQYDANGSMTQAGDRSIQWTSFNKPESFQRGGKTISFAYGPDRARYLKTGTTTEGNPQRTVYLGRLYEQETTNRDDGATVRHKHFVYADGQLAAIHIKTEEAGIPRPDETRYLHRDNLGSIDTITDGRGNIVERMSYEAFGARRAGNWRSADDPLAGIILPAFTNRGFTGHEHVDEMGLIHMNGRVYDPGLGRFLSADPNIQSPYSSQSYNRYSYVLNNPLKYTDPSGFFFKSLFKAVKKIFKSTIVRTVVAIAAAAIVGPAAMAWAGGGLAGAVVGGAAAGFAVGGISTGTWKGAFQGAVLGGLSGGVAFGIGHSSIFEGVRNSFGGWGTHVAHGLARGAMGAARGGRFGAGFASGFFGSAAPVGGIDNMMGRTIAASVLGGTASVLGGGKFGNGAITGVFAHLFSGNALRRPDNVGGSRFFRNALDVVGKIWALPNTIAGMIYGGVGHIAGWIMGTNPQTIFSHNAVQFINNPFVRRDEALTLGNTILYGSNTPPWRFGAYGDPSVNIGSHEEAHTYQYQALGPFYAPVYMLSGGFSGPSGNPLEQAAQDYGSNQGGWWPW
uniref:RHS repeat-associated core domain-containing protein n=1 Tax=Candidatus Kentrum sp. DK TaxID=2126562 RepID=A0A450TGA8_9GAMM|nr:MAG: RHS repeat-associated core domain-containing protein [Candidatus Kentron sp. DK]